MSFYFIFWDGVGYGKKNPKINPFFTAQLPAFKKYFHQQIPSLSDKTFISETVSYVPVNTTLRVAGLPQSGTGQTAIMTGVNAPKFIGKHFGPHPYSALVPIIKEKNLFKLLAQRQKKFYFANAYPKRYFDYIFGPKGKIPTIALSYISTGKELLSAEAILSRKAISADISGTRWAELGHPEVEPISPHNAGMLFYELGKSVDLIFFEYFVPDHAGHKQDMNMAVEILERMDGFVEGILKNFDWNNDVLLMISDHGNIEDLSVKTHTMNPVPLIVYGKKNNFFTSRIKNLTHITPAVISYFDSLNEQ
jgi:hypothetical protein